MSKNSFSQNILHVYKIFLTLKLIFSSVRNNFFYFYPCFFRVYIKKKPASWTWVFLALKPRRKSSTIWPSQFQPIPAYSSLFQPIAAYSSELQYIPAYSNLLQPISAYSILFQLITAYSSLFRHIAAHIFLPYTNSPYLTLSQPISPYLNTSHSI